MKCLECGGTGWTQIAPNVKGIKRCPVCNGTGVVGEITNYDYIRNCDSIDKLADEICKCILKNQWIINKEVIIKWLKEKHKEMNEPELSKEEYVEMLNERLGYLKDDIEFFAKYGGPTEENRLWAIKEQLSCMIRLVNQCDIDLFPDTIHLDNEYGRC